ncbi:hypothetical protein COU79_01245, partial [Candidatus Peregrinibacteria bacterium CG10_big_fil_rev_8_21_14_0_10_54_7]
QDNDAGGGTAVVCNDCVDSGNNTNWFFVTPTIVGTLYSDEGVTPLASKTVAISYNGGAVTDSITTDAGGQFSLSGAQMTGGTVLTLFVQGESEGAVTVVLGSGSTMTGIHLYQNRVIVRSESGSAAVTNTALAIARTTTSAGGDIPNILVSASSAGITVAANKELLVWSGSTFRPGGTVSTHDLDVNGTMDRGQYAATVSGSWDADAIYGSFSGTGVTTFTSTGSETIRSSGDSFGAVTFSHSAGSWTLQDAMDINGVFTLSGGTLTQGNNTLNVSGNVRIAAGSTFVKSTNGSRFLLDGDLTFENETRANVGFVQMGASPDTITLSGALAADRVVVGTGDVLVTNGYDLSVGTGGLTIYGVLNADDSGSNITQITLSGSWIASGTGDFLSGHSSVLFDGTAGSYQITSSGAFYDLVLNGTGATWTGNGTVDINGDLTLSAGTFNAPSTLTLSGSLTHGANATFSHNSGVFQLDGDTQTLSGTTAFYTLKKIAGVTSTLTFSARENFTVSGTLVLRGKDNNNRLSIRSSVSGVQSYLSLDTSGSESAIFLDVMDSNAGSGQTLTCLSCTDSGNNVNWVFTTPTVTGTLYSDEGVTALPGKTIAFAPNGSGVTATATTGAGGQYSLSGATLTGGTIILLYVDGAAEDAVTVVLGSGGNMTGIDLYQNRLIIRSASGTSAVTNAHIALADNNGGAAADSDVRAILSSATSGAITVAARKELLVWAGSTFAPGGTIDAENIDINGTLQQGAQGISVSGSWDAAGGSFTSNGTVTFDTAMGSGQVIVSNGSTFSGVAFSGTGTWFPRGAMDVNGNFTVSNGTFNQSGSTLSIAGNMRVASGAVFTKSINGALLTLDGDLIVEDETHVNLGTMQAGSSPDVITLSGSLRVHKLTVGTGDTLVLSGHNLYVGTGGLFLHGTIDASDRTNSGGAIISSTITVSGSWIAGGTGDFIAGHSSVLFNAGGGSFTISSSGSFYDLVIAGTGATYTATGSLDINGDLTLSAGTFTSTPGTITLSGSWMKGENATFNHSSGSVVLNGIDQTISGSTVFHNLTKSGSTAATLTFAASASTSVSGALLLRGTLTNNLSIRSGITGLVSFLSLDTGGSETLQYLNVKDNDASGGQPLTCNYCTDAGNNTNWLFVSPNITGTLYSDEGVTPLVARTIALSVNGGTISDTAETDASGQFVLSGATMTGGTVLTLFVNNETEDAVTVVLSSGSTMTGLHLYQNRVIVRSESGSSPVTLTTLDIANTLTDND